MLIALLLFIVCLALYLTGPIRRGIVLTSIVFSLLYFFFELWREQKLKKANELQRQEENAMWAIPLSHISGLNAPKLEICFLMLQEPSSWVLRCGDRRRVLDPDKLESIWALEPQTVRKLLDEDVRMDELGLLAPSIEELHDALVQNVRFAWDGLILIEYRGEGSWNDIWAFRPLDARRCFSILGKIDKLGTESKIKYPRFSVPTREKLEGEIHES